MKPITEDTTETDFIDPDIALIGDYLARALTPEQAAALEARLGTDAAFYDKAEPLLLLFGKGLDFREVWASYEREHGTLDISMPDVPPRITAKREPMRWHGWQVFPGRRSLLQIAAVLALWLGGTRVYNATHRASVLPGIDSIDELLSSASTPVDPASVTEVRTPRGQILTFVLPDSSAVELRSNSRFGYGEVARIAYGMRATLIGEAAIEVSPRKRAMLVVTPVGTVFLMPGSYAIRTDFARGAIMVTVGRGHALLLGGAPTDVRLFGAGEFGWMREGMPEITTSGSQFPKLTGGVRQ
jgi:hypothetical protein